MVKKFKVKESLKSNEISANPRIGVVNGKVDVNYYTISGRSKKLLSKEIYNIQDEYDHIEGILSELNYLDGRIPDDITYYNIESFNPFDSTLCLTYTDEDDMKIIIHMSLYETACFLSEYDLDKFGIE